MPLAGSRDSVPCGVWGNAPTVPRATNSKEEVNKGAGSEASLPVTSRSRRSAPQAALSTTCTLSRQMGATDQHREKSFLGAGLFCCREISPLRRRPDGFAVALWTPSHCTPMFLDFSCYRGYRACGRDKSATKQDVPFRERPCIAYVISLPDAPLRKRQRHGRRRSSRTARSRRSWCTPCPR